MKGTWLLPGSSRDVAVKMLKEGSTEEDTVKFLQEAAINGQFWHPNVVKLMGVVTVGEPVSPASHQPTKTLICIHLMCLPGSVI